MITEMDRSHPVVRDQVKERDMDRGSGGGGVEAVNSSHGKHRNQPLSLSLSLFLPLFLSLYFSPLSPLSICLLAILRWTTTSGAEYFFRKIYW